MNDRFKLRVWGKKQKRYFCCDYVGYCSIDYSGKGEKKIIFKPSGVDQLLTEGKVFYADESDVIIEQCTGLKDKKGKLIYEGDIVQTSFPYKTNNYEVKWGDGCWELWSKNRYIYTLYEVMCESLSVVGNIHENENLLEEQEYEI